MNTKQPWTEWIDEDIVHSLYADGIQKYKGFGSPSKPGCVDAALGAAYSAEMYSMPELDAETVVSGITFCGYLLFYLATKHCWTDGNKRVAWASATWALAMLGLTVRATDDEAYTFVTDIVEHKIQDGESAVNWIADRLDEIGS
jgi:prophage maintenance system killer protein